MNYEANKTQWQVGDLVLHDADAKRSEMLIEAATLAQRHDQALPPGSLQAVAGKPHRIQLSRKKGWTKPDNTVVVARPSRWGNPYPLSVARQLHPEEPVSKSAQRCVRAFAIYATGREDFDAWIAPLKGKNLACWCPLYDKKGLRVPCHADILLSLANDLPLKEICAPLTTRNSATAAGLR